MKNSILVITIILMILGIYRVETGVFDSDMELLRVQIQIYVSFSVISIIFALGGK